MSNEKKQNFELDFRVTHGSVEETFETMKNYQQMGVANNHSNIVFNDITVPAGYFNSLDGFYATYNAIVTEDIPTIKGIMGTLEETELDRFEMICLREIAKKRNAKQMSLNDEISAMLEASAEVAPAPYVAQK